MPLHMDISPLHRLVVIVARGQITPEEMAETRKALIEAKVQHFAKIIDVSQGRAELSYEQVQKIAALLQGAPDGAVDGARRGPVAFVIDPARHGFADLYADVTKGERPIELFRSLHDARAWLDRTREERR